MDNKYKYKNHNIRKPYLLLLLFFSLNKNKHCSPGWKGFSWSGTSSVNKNCLELLCLSFLPFSFFPSAVKSAKHRHKHKAKGLYIVNVYWDCSSGMICLRQLSQWLWGLHLLKGHLYSASGNHVQPITHPSEEKKEKEMQRWEQGVRRKEWNGSRGVRGKK